MPPASWATASRAPKEIFETGAGTKRLRTVSGSGAATHTNGGSEFVGYVDTTPDRAGAEAYIDTVRSKHPDASHVVSGYRVRRSHDFLIEHADDEGEPSNSAGAPVLELLEKRQIENLVVAVVRYFDGSELGIGGLVRAYSWTARAAIHDASVVERHPRITLQLTVEYDDSGVVRSVLESERVSFEASYRSRVTISADVPQPKADRVCDRLRSATGDRVRIEKR